MINAPAQVVMAGDLMTLELSVTTTRNTSQGESIFINKSVVHLNFPVTWGRHVLESVLCDSTADNDWVVCTLDTLNFSTVVAYPVVVRFAHNSSFVGQSPDIILRGDYMADLTWTPPVVVNGTFLEYAADVMTTIEPISGSTSWIRIRARTSAETWGVRAMVPMSQLYAEVAWYARMNSTAAFTCQQWLDDSRCDLGLLKFHPDELVEFYLKVMLNTTFVGPVNLNVTLNAQHFIPAMQAPCVHQWGLWFPLYEPVV